MAQAADGLGGSDALGAMGAAYLELMQDPDVLQVQLHGFAAAPGDPDIAALARRTFGVLWHLVHERTGLPDDEIRAFFAMGMMINVLCATDLLSVSDHWAQSFCPVIAEHPEKAEAVRNAASAVARRRQESVTEEVSA
jgi:hypothetical protein